MRSEAGHEKLFKLHEQGEWSGYTVSFVPFFLLAETNIKITLISFLWDSVSGDLLSHFSKELHKWNSTTILTLWLKQTGNPQKYNHLCYKQGTATCEQSNILLYHISWIKEILSEFKFGIRTKKQTSKLILSVFFQVCVEISAFQITL